MKRRELWIAVYVYEYPGEKYSYIPDETSVKARKRVSLILVGTRRIYYTRCRPLPTAFRDEIPNTQLFSKFRNRLRIIGYVSLKPIPGLVRQDRWIHGPYNNGRTRDILRFVPVRQYGKNKTIATLYEIGVRDIGTKRNRTYIVNGPPIIRRPGVLLKSVSRVTLYFKFGSFVTRYGTGTRRRNFLFDFRRKLFQTDRPKTFLENISKFDRRIK